MTITSDAKKILDEILEKYNKCGILLNYNKDTKEIAMGLVDNDTNEKLTNVDGVNFVFKNGAEVATSNWLIVEQNGKLTIQRKDKCCCDDKCEYVCNKVSCKCDDSK